MQLIDDFNITLAGNTHYILVLEYIKGTLLKNWGIANIPYNKIVDIMLKINGQLIHIHDNGIVHRDLTYKNIIVTEDSYPVIIDWGGARSYDPKQALYNAGKIEPGITTIGTRGWFAPDILLRRPPTPATDIYMLGLILNYLLTGNIRADPADWLKQRVEEFDFELHPKSFNSTIPMEFDRIVSKATKKEPSQRYKTVKEFSQALKQIRDAMSGTKRENRCITCGKILDEHSKFCTNCGTNIDFRPLQEAFLEIFNNGGVIPITDYVTVGRDTIGAASIFNMTELNEHYFPKVYTFVSRKHFAVKREEDKYYLQDLGSTNGTYLDNIRLIPKRWYELRDGVHLRIIGSPIPDNIKKELGDNPRIEVSGGKYEILIKFEIRPRQPTKTDNP
jgi:serine/threonine protein kinase